ALSASAPSAAQSAIPPSGEMNAAERADKLFSEANKLAESGNYEAACPKFAESQRLDPALGTEYNLAVCYEKIGRLGAAYRALRSVEQVAHTSGKQSREDAAKEKLAQLRPRVSHLVLVTQDREVTVKIDGERIDPSEWNFVAVDAGDRVVEATASARMPWR